MLVQQVAFPQTLGGLGRMITGPMMATSLASRVDEIAAMGRWPMTAPGAAESYSPPWGPVWPTEGGRTLAGAEGASGETNQIEAQEKQEPENQVTKSPPVPTDPELSELIVEQVHLNPLLH